MIDRDDFRYSREEDYRDYRKDYRKDYKEVYPVAVYGRKRKRSFVRSMAAVLTVITVGGTSLGFGIGAGLSVFNNVLENNPLENRSSPEEYSMALSLSETLSENVPDVSPEFSDVLMAQGMAQNPVYTQTNSDSTNNFMPFASVSEVFNSVRDSVVSINITAPVTNFFNQTTEKTGAGSGIIFREDAEKIYIVTNYHVIDSASSVTISIDDKIEVRASGVGGDPKADVAVISVNKSDLIEAGITNYTIARFGDSDNLDVGDAVIAIGNALGEGKSATFGIVSTEEKHIDIEGTDLVVIQTDAAINPGNSGGALVNIKGEVIGINTAKLASSGVEGMGYAIPINIARTLIDEIMEKGTIERPYLGVSLIEIDEEIYTEYNMPSYGIYIAEIVRNSTAANAGMRTGDIITSINGKSIMTADQLTDAINSIKIGTEFTITVVRTTTSGRYMFSGQQNITTEEITLNARMQNYGSEMNF